jgi:hypothetical protein
VIRKLCTEFDTGKAVPHVWAGEVEAGNRLAGKIPALVLGVWFHVVTRLTGEAADGKEYRARRNQALDLLETLREDENVLKKVGNEDEDWKDWENVTKKDVDNWLREIGIVGWNQMEWLQNIEEGSGASGTVANGADEEMEDAEDVTEPEPKRMRGAGLGTMIQPKIDLLSEEYREEYAVWKKAMLAKIEELLAEGIISDNEMDTTEG